MTERVRPPMRKLLLLALALALPAAGASAATKKEKQKAAMEKAAKARAAEAAAMKKIKLRTAKTKKKLKLMNKEFKQEAVNPEDNLGDSDDLPSARFGVGPNSADDGAPGAASAPSASEAAPPKS